MCAGLVVLLAVIGAAAGAGAASAETLAAGFHDTALFSGLKQPTAVRFAPAPDTRVFVAQQSGQIEVYRSLSDTQAPTQVADLSTEVFGFWDRGLLGLAVDPHFPAQPYIYVLYAYDAPIGGTAPVWNDTCPNPTTVGCVVSGRLSRLTIDPATNKMVTGGEKVLINDWCQQYPSHSVDDLAFGSDGDLYVSAGSGQSWTVADYGQGDGTDASSINPCGDPPTAVGRTPPAAAAEGGALRAQSFLRPSSQLATLDGTVIRVDPGTGAAVPGNPAYTQYAGEDPDRQRILAYGLRQPYRFTFQPGTAQMWIGDVGQDAWEEIDRLSNPTASPPTDFGWPCYEGADPIAQYQSLNNGMCNLLYASRSAVATPPFYVYEHGVSVVPGDGCTVSKGSSITGLAFTEGVAYPPAYRGALFFADHSRSCIWAMLADSPGGTPDPAKVVTIASPAGHPVDLQRGPDGALYYADLDDGEIHRLAYTAPQANASATPASGDAPLTVSFSGDASSDPEPGVTLTYQWNFGDGSPATTAAAGGSHVSHTYQQAGVYTATLTVVNQRNESSSQAVTVTAEPPPVATASATPTSGAAPLGVTFTGHSSGDGDPSVALTYRWDFGDGASATPADGDVTHTYSGAGTYTAVLTVLDPWGASSSTQVVVAVTAAPPLLTGLLPNSPGILPAPPAPRLVLAGCVFRPSRVLLARPRAPGRAVARLSLHCLLSRAARVRLTISKVAPASRSDRHSQPATATILLPGRNGHNVFDLATWVAHHHPAPGRYRARIQGGDTPATLSKATYADFVVLAPSRASGH